MSAYEKYCQELMLKTAAVIVYMASYDTGRYDRNKKKPG